MHTRTAAAAITAALLLAGCSSSDGEKTVSKKDQFLTAVRAADFESWEKKGPADDELLKYPQQWCDAIADGHTVEWIFTDQGDTLYPIGWEWGTKESDAEELLILAVKAYCPKLRGQVVEELRSIGAY